MKNMGPAIRNTKDIGDKTKYSFITHFLFQISYL